MEGTIETTYMEIKTKAKKDIIVGSLYRPPNTSEKDLSNHLSEILPEIKTEKGNKQVILGMNHNLHLLKSSTHKPTQKFLDIILDNELLLFITRPTRITHQSATLIDNVFISEFYNRTSTQPF